MVAWYPVSTAANGPGFGPGSNCTPTGRFRVWKKIGRAARLGTIFKSREAVGHWSGETCGEDLILSRILWLDGLDAAQDTVLLMEVMGECTYVPHHPQKIILILSAMRHFARALEARGVAVDYIRLDDPANTQSFAGEVARAVARHRPERVIATHPGEWRVLQLLRDWAAAAPVPVQWREDDRFLCSRERFESWLKGRKAPRMEHFYRDMRRHTGWLMRDGEPEGGEWNYDADNRESLPADQLLPVRLRALQEPLVQ
jgi:deoxyribodipyrimidine photolyase-related protein